MIDLASLPTGGEPAIVQLTTENFVSLPNLSDADGWHIFFVNRCCNRDATSSVSGFSLQSALFDYLTSPTSADAQVSLDINKGRLLWLQAHAGPEAPSEMLPELRRLLGYSWMEVAGLLSVDRRSIHSWNTKSLMRKKNRERVSKIFEAVRYADRGTPEKNRELLDRLAPNGDTFAGLLKSGDIQTFKQLAGLGVGRTAGTPMNREWLDDYGRRPSWTEDNSIPSAIVAIESAPAKGKVKHPIRRA